MTVSDDIARAMAARALARGTDGRERSSFARALMPRSMQTTAIQYSKRDRAQSVGAI